jgi:methylglutaconyl-CoA hydratase
MSAESPVRFEIEGHVGWLTIDRAAARNALNPSVIHGLASGIRSAEETPEVRALVVTGAGDRAFCAGGDLKPDARTFGVDHAAPRTPYADLLRAAWRCPLPMIARVNGHCLAGGMGLLAMCDMAIASSTALFGLPETKIGLFPMQVAALLLPQIPFRKFSEMCITGEPITAAEALAFDLVNYVVEPADLDAKVRWLLSRTLDKSPTAIRRGKYALRAIHDMTVEQALAYMEGQIASLPYTEDSVEGMRAFNEKRAPVWTGR